ncbi:MAG: ABC transporter ATP-binding protein [Betaproteobacteria bacterium]|nr:ABC transporter ATP-binding protein [Betaproteobacteria bacterium]
MLSCSALTLAAPGRVLARGLDFTVRPGEVWAVLGANGSGKTTLIHALGGLAPEHAGTVALDGAPLSSLGAHARAARVGILLQQEDAVFWGSVLDYVLLGRFPHASAWLGWQGPDEEAARAALAAVGLAEYAARVYSTLSGGERQRARVAQLLAQDPQVLLLDEPLQHLDLRHQVAVLELVGALASARGRCVLMVLHDALWPARFCSHALLLHAGGVVEHGTAREMLTRERLERLYSCPLQEIESKGARFFAPV